MKFLFSKFIICVVALSGIYASQAYADAENVQLLKKSKILFDLHVLSQFRTDSCGGAGSHCESSVDCCGSISCQDNYCSDPGNNNLPPGAHCNSSSECEGSSTCQGGFCNDPGNNNIPPGSHCNSSSECQGSSMCQGGFCSDPGIGNIPPGGHCNSSSECMHGDICRAGFCY